MKWLFSNPASVDHDKVINAIHAAYELTSGEIRVLIARHKAAHPIAAAHKHFIRLKMDQSPLHNSVLIFIAPRSKTFAVIGDSAVHEKCGDAFWSELTQSMITYFKKDDFTSGVIHGIERAAELLSVHFPHEKNQKNKLPEQVEDVD
jgi:uncharacterized membrane protein